MILLKHLLEIAVVEKAPKMEGRSMTMVLGRKTLKLDNMIYQGGISLCQK